MNTPGSQSLQKPATPKMATSGGAGAEMPTPSPQASTPMTPAGTTKPAKLLAVFVVDTNEKDLTTDIK